MKYFMKYFQQFSDIRKLGQSFEKWYVVYAAFKVIFVDLSKIAIFTKRNSPVDFHQFSEVFHVFTGISAKHLVKNNWKHGFHKEHLLKDTHWEKTPSNKTPMLTKSMNMDIWIVSTSNQLFLRDP